MKSHWVVLYYIFTGLVGSLALVVSILGTVRSRDKSYWLLVSFYGGFTALIFVDLFRQYVMINTGGLSLGAFVTTQALMTGITISFMTFVTLYMNRVFLSIRQGFLDLGIVVYSAVSFVLFILPGSVVPDLSHDVWRLNAPARVAQLMHIGLFIYLLILSFAGRKKDRSVRELVLIWSLILFTAVGFLENTISFIQHVGNPTLRLVLEHPSFIVSSIPYLIFGVVLFYYFGSFLLANTLTTRPEMEPQDLADRYGLSPRELEVLPLLNRGLSNREIAEAMYISLATVKTHLHKIYEKTGVKSRYELFGLTAATDS